jgi:hypothetical protein
VFRYFSSYHEQRATHYRKLVEQLERDLIDSAKSEGEALTRERKLLEDVKQLRGELARMQRLERLPAPTQIRQLKELLHSSRLETQSVRSKLQARIRQLEPDADVVELHPPHRPLTMPDVPRED